jgi:aspartate aminotransferase-like enzyme
VLAGGQEQLSGKMLRIGHMGACEVRDLFTALNCLQVRLKEFGFNTNTHRIGGITQC